MRCFTPSLPSGGCSDIEMFSTRVLRVRMFLRMGSLQTKLNAGLSEQQQEDLFQNERSFHEVKL